MLAVTIGTTSFRQTAVLAGNEVEFTGTWVTDTDGVTPLMVWDGGLNNVRAMTGPELAALPAQRLAAARAAVVAALAASISVDRNAASQRAFVLVARDEINILRAAIPHPIVSITRVTTTATVTTYDPHGLTTGDSVRITGATLAAYNLLATVTVLTTTTFTYVVAGSPATPALGSIIFQRGTLPTMADRTLAQLPAAMTTKINAGSADA